MQLLLLLGVVAATAGRTAPPQIGDPAPDFELSALDGSPVRRAQLAGQVTVVEFFASWCVPCGRSQEDLRAIRADLGPSLRILIMALEGDQPGLRAFLAKNPLPEGAVIALAARTETAQHWGMNRLPTTFFVDRGAIIRHINRGHGAGFRVRATRWLRAMLVRDPD